MSTKSVDEEASLPLVLATRPVDQNVAWASSLRAQGYAVIECPLMSIQPVLDDAAKQAIKNTLLDLDQFQKVIFVSQNAVAFFFDEVEHYWPQLPIKIAFIGVGQKTQKAINLRLAAVDPAYPVLESGEGETALADRMTSESLLQSATMQNVAQQKILICRGRGGLPTLGQTLAQRGAAVTYCELYDRCLPKDAAHEVTHWLSGLDASELGKPVAIPVFSGESLENFNALLHNGSNNAVAENVKKQAALILPSARVAELAKKTGWAKVHIASNATETEMMASLKTALQ